MVILINDATAQLTGPQSRDNAHKILILINDGLQTTIVDGTNNPRMAAMNARNRGIEIFVIQYIKYTLYHNHS